MQKKFSFGSVFMLILFETINGYALIQKAPEFKRKFRLHAFFEFKNKKDSIKSLSNIIQGKIGKNFVKFLKNNLIPQLPLIVNDAKIKTALLKKWGFSFWKILLKKGLYREIRSNLGKILGKKDYPSNLNRVQNMTHSIFGYKIKLNGSKMDTAVIYTIRLLEEIDKELNCFYIRLKEWYSWHFPELAEIITDKIVYAEVISKIETKKNLRFIDLSKSINKEAEIKVIEASETSLGVDIFPEDLFCILSLCTQIIFLNNFRQTLQGYLHTRMYNIAPNLTALVGEKLGGKLISHAGSLLNLAKSPASSIQIFGAEKALFRAIKMRTKTPKYGIIFNSTFVKECETNIKGKVSRILSGKIALASRIDALGEFKYGGSIGLKKKFKIEKRIEQIQSFFKKKPVLS
mmetsp:Transcript_28166/g.57131  ORF Transcript_28166/g.57131 Transcript_28166/m.57131 type:complete len:403 (+) Transcript_28166:2456-3664(+)